MTLIEKLDSERAARKSAEAQVKEFRNVLRAIRDYPHKGGRRTKDGYPTEIVYDEYAYKRMIDSYRDTAREALKARARTDTAKEGT